MIFSLSHVQSCYNVYDKMTIYFTQESVKKKKKKAWVVYWLSCSLPLRQIVDSSLGRVKPKPKILVFGFFSPIRRHHLGERANTSWIGIRIMSMSRSRSISLSVEFCFSEIAYHYHIIESNLIPVVVQLDKLLISGYELNYLVVVWEETLHL